MPNVADNEESAKAGRGIGRSTYDEQNAVLTSKRLGAVEPEKRRRRRTSRKPSRPSGGTRRGLRFQKHTSRLYHPYYAPEQLNPTYHFN